MQSMYGLLVPPAAQGHPLHQADEDTGLGSSAMAPPPDSEFRTREELLTYLKGWAASQGYAVVIGRSRTNRLWIRCDRGGEYRDKHANDPSARQRKRKESRLTGCEFSIKASMRKDGIWRSRCECGEHNHGPSEDLREHPSLRRMTEQQMTKVHELTEEGKTPADIMKELNKIWPDIKVIRRDIYNARKNFKTGKDGASEGSPNRSFDSTRLSAPSDSGRWASWSELHDEGPSKKRKLNASSSITDRPSNGGPSTQLALESLASIPSLSSLSDQNPAHSGAWSQTSFSGPSQRPGMASPTSTVAFSPQSTGARSSAATPMRTPSNDFANASASTSHLSNSLQHSSAFYPPPPLINTTPGSSFSLPPALNTSPQVQDRRGTNQVHGRSSLRNPPVGNAPTSPGASRRPSQATAAFSVQSNAALKLPASASTSAGTSRPQNSSQMTQASASQVSMPALYPSSSSQHSQPQSLPLAQSQSQAQQQPQSLPQSQQAQQVQSHQPQPQQPKVQSGAVIMQRIQRMEDDLREQKTVLNQILTVVKDLAQQKA